MAGVTVRNGTLEELERVDVQEVRKLLNEDSLLDLTDE
jgi:hypothetical protein